MQSDDELRKKGIERHARFLWTINLAIFCKDTNYMYSACSTGSRILNEKRSKCQLDSLVQLLQRALFLTKIFISCQSYSMLARGTLFSESCHFYFPYEFLEDHTASMRASVSY